MRSASMPRNGCAAPQTSCPTAKAKLTDSTPRPVAAMMGSRNSPVDWRTPIVISRMVLATSSSTRRLRAGDGVALGMPKFRVSGEARLTEIALHAVERQGATTAALARLSAHSVKAWREPGKGAGRISAAAALAGRVGVHHQPGATAGDMRNDRGAPMNFCDGAEVNGEGKFHLLALAQPERGRMHEHAVGT